MNRAQRNLMIIGFLICLIPSHVLAAESDVEAAKSQFFSVLAFSCAFGMAIASGLCGIAQAKAIKSAMEAISRQPSIAKDVQTALVISLALIEALGLYTLVVALLLIFQVKPF
ncbi:MAG TPA: ATP synthase F0 subunit C [bacterium]|nr:ATP synthase F0 subunit C [bacterium]